MRLYIIYFQIFVRTPAEGCTGLGFNPPLLELDTLQKFIIRGVYRA